MIRVALTPYFVSTPRHHNPIMIVIHSTGGGTLNGAVTTLRKKHLGYHFIIDKDGTIYQGCQMDHNCGHAGNSYGPLEAERGISRKQNERAEFIARTSVNDYAIGVSFVQALNESLTAKQEQAVRELIADILRKKPFVTWITGHKNVSPRRKIDPYSEDLVPTLAKEFKLKFFKLVHPS